MYGKFFGSFLFFCFAFLRVLGAFETVFASCGCLSSVLCVKGFVCEGFGFMGFHL